MDEKKKHEEQMEKAVYGASSDITHWLYVQLGPMLRSLMDWDRLEDMLRDRLIRVYEAGVNTESGMRTQDAMASSLNVLRAALAGHAIGTGDSEQIERTKELLGVEDEETTDP